MMTLVGAMQLNKSKVLLLLTFVLLLILICYSGLYNYHLAIQKRIYAHQHVIFGNRTSLENYKDEDVDCYDEDGDTADDHDCYGLEGMRVLLSQVHLEGNLGDELETTPLLQELKRCKIVTIALLSNWITHPNRVSGRSVREHHLIDEIISLTTEGSALSTVAEVYPNLKYDAIIYAPGPGGFRYKDKKNSIPVDIHFGDSILNACGFPKELSLAVLREPESIRCIETANRNATTVPTYYMMGDLANIFEPAWSMVKFWREFYEEKYKGISTLVYSRDINFNKVVHFEAQNNNTKVTLKLLNPKSGESHPSNSGKGPWITLNISDILFVSDSPVEDPKLIDLQEGIKHIRNVNKDKFLMLNTIEQMFALTQHVQNIYTDRYHPGVIGYRFRKHVKLLDLSGSKPFHNAKLVGLQKLMDDFPDPRVIQQERIPTGFKMLRDTLRKLRLRATQK